MGATLRYLPAKYRNCLLLGYSKEKRKINSFLVTNGTQPAMLKKLLEKKAQPTQLYITLPAPDKATYENYKNSKLFINLGLYLKYLSEIEDDPNLIDFLTFVFKLKVLKKAS